MLQRLQELAAELVESSLDVPGFRECAIRVGGIWWVIRIGEAELVVRELTEAGEARSRASTPSSSAYRSASSRPGSSSGWPPALPLP